MNIFLEEQTKPLTTKRKALLCVMVCALTYGLAYGYGYHEWKQSDNRRMMMPVSMALPAELPTQYVGKTDTLNIWEF
jgi:hypothetical protein